MNAEMIERLCLKLFSQKPQAVARCGVGTGNYVYIVELGEQRLVFRCGQNCSYTDTVSWLNRLWAIGIPVPQVLKNGSFEGYEYLVLSYIEGKDLGLVYPELSEGEKRKLAKQVVEIQDRVAGLPLDNLAAGWKWSGFVEEMLGRARERIARNGYFDVEKVDRLSGRMGQFQEYFAAVEPVAYLDDITTKNLLIHKGALSGIIDVDWIGIGDRLTQAALTYTALLNMECDIHYVEYILEEMNLSGMRRSAFLFYALLYCVDFMGERGTRFMDKAVEVNPEIVERLNRIYDTLWKGLEENQWQGACICQS